MKITYDFLARQDTQALVGRILATPTDQRASYWLGRLAKKLDSVRAQMVLDFEKNIAGVFGEKNPDGSWKTPQEPVEGYFYENGIMINDAKRADYTAAIQTLGKMEVEVDMDKLPRSFLADIKVTPKEEYILDYLFESPESNPTVSQIAKLVDKST